MLPTDEEASSYMATLNLRANLGDQPRPSQQEPDSTSPGSLFNSSSTLTAISDTHDRHQQGTQPTGTQTADFQEDKYIFKDTFGKRFKEHLKKFGEGLHFPEIFSPKTPSDTGAEMSALELERMPAEKFEDITRLIWSAFRVPFNAFCLSKEGHRPVPVILSLLKVLVSTLPLILTG